jgi:hypothetical protein
MLNKDWFGLGWLNLWILRREERDKQIDIMLFMPLNREN